MKILFALMNASGWSAVALAVYAGEMRVAAWVFAFAWLHTFAFGWLWRRR